MMKKMLWLILAFAPLRKALRPDSSKLSVPLLQPLPQETQAAHLASEFLTHYHYKAAPLDNAMSEKIFDRYLKSLDPEKVFFVQADISQALRMRSHAALTTPSPTKSLRYSAFIIFNLYEQRLPTERFNYARSLLKQGFDFTQKESYQYIRDKAPWPKSEDEARDLWRKRVKNDWLRLKLAGKDEKSIVATLE